MTLIWRYLINKYFCKITKGGERGGEMKRGRGKRWREGWRERGKRGRDGEKDESEG